MRKHIGFKEAAANVASKEHLPMKNAAAIIAAGAMKASSGAKQANPALNKVAAAQHGAFRKKAQTAMNAARKASY